MASVYRRSGGEWVTRVTDMENWTLPDPDDMFDEWGLNGEERDAALRTLTEAAMMPPDKLAALDDVTAAELLAGYQNLHPAVYGYFAYLINAMNVGVIELVPMAELIRCMRSLMEGPLGYPAGGYGRLVEDMAEVLKADGGEVQTRARVDAITVEDGRVSGVVTKDGAFKAPIVVSNAGIHPTVLKLLGEEHFDKSYVSYVKGLLPSLGFTAVRYILDKPVLSHAVYQIWSEDSWWDMERYDEARSGVVPKDVTITVTVPTNYDADMGPPGKQLVLAGTNCPPDPNDDSIRMLWDKVDHQLAEILPEMDSAVESREAHAGPAQVSSASRDQVLPGLGGEAVGVGVTIDQCGKHKPSARAPIPGLFYVGFDAGSTGGYMGTQQAVHSGLNVARMVHQYHLEKRLTAVG
jgi:phytoene dehydrogenase-like protein